MKSSDKNVKTLFRLHKFKRADKNEATLTFHFHYEDKAISRP